MFDSRKALLVIMPTCWTNEEFANHRPIMVQPIWGSTNTATTCTRAATASSGRQRQQPDAHGN